MIIAVGAEAIIKREGNCLHKERIPKLYRLGVIDEALRKKRTKSEARNIDKANKLVLAPKLYGVKGATIVMDFIDGITLRDCLEKVDRKKIFERIGKATRKMHDANLVHGDLTTSNLIIKKDEPYFIDFGLSFVSAKTEDKAVDIHLMKQALESKHNELSEECFSAFMRGYNPDKEFVERLVKVENRGRYKRKHR